MKPRLLLSIVALGTAMPAFAATGTFGSGVTFSTTSTESTPIASGDHNSFDADINLGTFGTTVGNTLDLTGAGILTSKSGGGDVTGAKFNYRVFKVGDTPGGFTEITLGFGSNNTFTEYGITGANSGDQMWGDSVTYGGGFSSIDLLAGRSNGTYTLEWFSYSITNEIPVNDYESNSGNNFKATFTVVPEPASATLGLIGALALLRRRRN